MSLQVRSGPFLKTHVFVLPWQRQLESNVRQLEHTNTERFSQLGWRKRLDLLNESGKSDGRSKYSLARESGFGW
jgi:hypothetical protein